MEQESFLLMNFLKQLDDATVKRTKIILTGRYK